MSKEPESNTPSTAGRLSVDVHPLVSLLQEAENYMSTLSPHMIERQGPTITRRLMQALAKNLDDTRRLDWLADRDNHIGNVQLPNGAVMENLHSMRAAIDAARFGTYTQNTPMDEQAHFETNAKLNRRSDDAAQPKN